MKVKINYSVIFSLIVMAATAWLLYLAWDWPWETKFFPFVTCFTILGLCLLQLIVDIILARNPTSQKDKSGVVDLPVDEKISAYELLRRGIITWGWFIGFIVSIALIGFVISIPLFVLAYMSIQGREKPWVVTIWTLLLFIFTVGVFDLIVHTRWPVPWWEAPEEQLLRFIHYYISSGV